MTSPDTYPKYIRVNTLGDRHGNKIKIKPDNNRPDRIYFRAPLMSLLDRDMAIEIANALADLVDSMPDEGVGES